MLVWGSLRLASISEIPAVFIVDLLYFMDFVLCPKSYFKQDIITTHSSMIKLEQLIMFTLVVSHHCHWLLQMHQYQTIHSHPTVTTLPGRYAENNW